MALILHINTALDTGSVSLASHTEVMGELKNENRAGHAAWLHPAIERLMSDLHIAMEDLHAIAVVNGPGSYTGLRIGLSAAKGLCYALKLPLIAISTLEWIAMEVKDEGGDLIIPMIDARRNEVFTAVYERSIREKISPYALVLEPGVFEDLLARYKIIFAGSGSGKAAKLISHPHASFSPKEAGSGAIAQLSFMRFDQSRFSDLAYCEPFYVKEFQTAAQTPGKGAAF